MTAPTPEDDAYARLVEQVAAQLAEFGGDRCFYPLHDDEAGFRARAQWREQARATLNEVGHRDLWTELRRINDLLREHGHEYPLGARGVSDALGVLQARLDDPDYLRETLARIEREGEAS